MPEARQIDEFWAALEEATDPGAYRPVRHTAVVASRLTSEGEPYYILKQPAAGTYLRLTEEDYALWWQMNGRKRVKDLLLYSMLRFKSLPVGRLNRLVADLRAGGFLQDAPSVDLYGQVTAVLAQRSAAEQGRRLLRGFFYSEWDVNGLDPAFTTLYRWTRWLFSRPVQLLLLLLVVVGGVAFGRVFAAGTYRLAEGGLSGLIMLVLANLLVLCIHELAHGLTVKQFGCELQRGGFLIYWGFPAFFVDTRDTWRAPARERVLVSWAGPYSGLILAGISGGLLALAPRYADQMPHLALVFLFQIGFIGMLSAFVNLNPLLELDGYFMLMDSLDVPNLRPRAFAFWRRPLWQHVRRQSGLAGFWNSLSRTERLLVIYGGLALAYTLVALGLALYFWQARMAPLLARAWGSGVWGRGLTLALMAAILVPLAYYSGMFFWDRLGRGLDWLARRDLLARPALLTVLIGLPLLGGLALFWWLLGLLPLASIWQTVLVLAVHVAAALTLVGVAQQLPGSRFQWVWWTLSLVPLALLGAWAAGSVVWLRDTALLAAATAVLAAGLVAWQTVSMRKPVTADLWLVATWAVVGLLAGLALWSMGALTPTAVLVLLGVAGGLAAFSPLLVNFWRTRFFIPWLLLTLAMLLTAADFFVPGWFLAAAVVWLLAGLVTWVVGALAQFQRIEDGAPALEMAVYDETRLLVSAYDRFLTALFASYEPVFGRRPAALRAELPAPTPEMPIAAVRAACRAGLLRAADWLDDLAGTTFTLAAGRAAYDSLPWLEAETLGRQVLADFDWGSELARGFVRARDRRRQLLRQADIFAGFDQAGLDALLAIVETRRVRHGRAIAAQGADATAFFLVESGQVTVQVDGRVTATIAEGGYFGTHALLPMGVYRGRYVADGNVVLLAIPRARYDPLWRADTTLASQVRAGAQERTLLRQMPLFSGLSPQQLAVVDARLVRKPFAAGETLARQGETRSHLFILVDGRVDIWQADEAAGERWVGSMGPGEHFGEYALFADTPYAATYRAAMPTEALLLDEATFDRLTAECEPLSHYVEQIGTGRATAVTRRRGPAAILA